MAYFLSTWVKFFVLLTPFFALSLFLLYTANMAQRERNRLALRVTAAVLVVSLTLFFLGQSLFSIVGITIDSFRVGAGILLFLSAVSLVQGVPQGVPDSTDLAVVPLAVPVIVGPATTGAILIMGAEVSGTQQYVALGALVVAILCIGILLLMASLIERLVRRRGIVILTKLTGLVLSALASQMVVDGVRKLWSTSGS